MSPLRTITQSQFMRGLNAVAGILSQPRGSVPQVSNLWYSRVGSLETCDGTESIASPASGYPAECVLEFSGSTSATHALGEALISQNSPMLVELAESIAAPTGESVAASTGGQFLTASYTFAIGSWDGNGGFGLKGSDLIISLTAGNSAQFTWSTSTGAAIYQLISGVYRLIAVAPSSPWTVYLPAGTGNRPYSGIDTTEQTALDYAVGAYSYPDVRIPATPVRSGGLLWINQLTDGSVSPSLAGYSIPNGSLGGIVGFPGPLPQIIGFNTKEIIALGNTYPPQSATNAVPGASPTEAAGTGSNSGSGTAWTNPSNVSSTSAYATNVVAPHGSYQYLYAESFGFSLAASPAISGFQVSFTYENGNNLAVRLFVQLLKAGVPVGSSQVFFPLASASGAEGTVGGNGSLFGASLSYTDVNASNFGVSFLPFSSDLPGVTVGIRNVRITVFTGVVGSVTALANTYTVAYPSWVANSPFNAGDVIQPGTPNGHYYVAQNNGISGATAPTFPTNGSEVSDGTMIWKDGGQTAIVAPRGAAHVLNHASCLFLWNTYPSWTSDGLDGPAMLAQSDVNNENSWNPVNRVPIGKGDGQTGTGIASFTIAEAGIAPTLSIIMFKEFSSYVMTGLLPNASITQVQTDMGCTAPRSIQFVPGYGIIRLTHKGFAITDGIGDRVISGPIRPYLFPNTEGIVPNDAVVGCLAHAFQTWDPPMYCCALSTAQNSGVGDTAELGFNRLACFDLELRCWTIIDLPFDAYACGSLDVAFNSPSQIPALGDDANGNLWSWALGASGWNDGTKIAWSVTLPPVLSNGTTRVYFDQLFISGSTLDGDVEITVELFSEGNAENPVVSVPYNFSIPGQFTRTMAVKETAINMWAKISGSGRVTIDSASWQVAPQEAGVPMSLMAG